MDLDKLVQKTKNIKVLYVEDEKEVREQTQRFLNHYFKEIVVSFDGQEAWEEFQKTNFDLIISDLKMPKMSGTELIKKIKETSPSLPIIAMSGLSSNNGIEPEGTIKLTKPVSIEAFEKALEKALKLNDL